MAGQDGLGDLRGGCAVITGGAAGIGLAVAERCVRELGMRVVLADLSPSALEAAVAQLGPAHACGVVTDVSSWRSVEQLRAAVLDAHEAVSLLFCNAGIGAGGSVSEASLEDWHRVLGVNLLGVVHCVRAFVPRMKVQARPGRVAITASMMGLVSLQAEGPPWGSAPYNTSKAAVVALAEELVREFRPHPHLRCHVLCPGIVATNIVANSLEAKERAQGAALSQEDKKIRAEIQAYYREHGIPPGIVASELLTGIRDGRFCVTVEDGCGIHTLMRQRHEELLTGRMPAVPAPTTFLTELWKRVAAAGRARL